MSKVFHVINGNNGGIKLYFRRTIPNKSSVSRADLIVEGNLFVNALWPTVKFEKISWDEDPYNDITWCFYLHSLDIIGYLMNGYEIEPKVEYLTKAKEIICSWIKANPSKEDQMSFYAWKDHSVANRVVNMIQFWMHYKESSIYEENFKEILMKSLIQHGDYLVLDCNHTFHNNHGIFQDRSLMELAIIFPELPNSRKWYEAALVRFLKHVEKDVSESGVHLEHSDSYHILVLRLFKSINEFLNYYNRKNDLLERLIYKMEEHLAYIVKVDGTIPMTGDSEPNRIDGLSKKEIINEKLLYVITKEEKGRKPESSMVYHDAGIAIVRNHWRFNDRQIYLRFLTAFHSLTHKHADDLSFLLSIGQTDFFTDSGKYNYKEKDPYRKYFRSTMAHNTITINKESYPIKKELVGKSRLTHFVDTADYVYIEGEHELYEDTLVRRTLFYIRESETILILDKLKSEIEQTYSQIFNMSENVHVIPLGHKRCLFESKLNGKMIELRQINPVEEFKHYKGNTKPILGWISTKFNEKMPIDQIQYTNKAKELEFRTIINTDLNKAIKYFSVSDKNGNPTIKVRYKNNVIKFHEVKKN